MRFKLFLMVAALVLGFGAAAPAAELVSGPQVGTTMPGPFEPLNLNGRDADEEACLFCRYGNAPVVMIFAKSHSEGLTLLVRALDKVAVKNEAKEMGVCVVYLDTAEPLKKTAKKVAETEKLKQVVLSCIKADELEDYKFSKDAETTVILYSKRTVRANHAFKKDELNEKGIEKILADLPKIGSEK